MATRPLTLDDLFPPNEDYPYFAGAREHPFPARADELSTTAAWWLAECSLLAYHDEAFVRERLESTGLGFEVESFAGATTQAFLLDDGQTAVAAFRGTQVDHLKEILLDTTRVLEALPVADSTGGAGGRVHAGFRRALDEVWDRFSARVRALSAAGRRIVLTGHSLGGALATLAASRLGPAVVEAVYAFGCPRVGNRTFASRFRVPCFRFVNHLDYASRLPPGGLYQHVGREQRFDRRLPLAPGLAKLVPTPVADHAPINYALLTRQIRDGGGPGGR